MYHLNDKQDNIYYSSGHVFLKMLIVIIAVIRLSKELLFRKYDIVFVQREAFMLGISFFEKQFSKRSKLIFDFDDTIWMTQTGEVKSKNRSLYFLKNPLKTRNIIASAQLVFAGNNFLANYARQFNSNVAVIPTTIDTKEYLIVVKPDKEKICIGWSGSFSTIIHFEYVLDALKMVKEKYRNKVYFKVIGDGSYECTELSLKGISWNKETELDDLSEIDIGIMPLPDDEWTRGKCGLKGLQYMGLGIPCIMSPVGVNKEIISDGENGFIAKSSLDWVNKISSLIEDHQLRIDMGLKGRKTVEENYSVAVTKESYLKHFNDLVQ